ncbi:tetratricopeptide repeat protein [Candidatus Chloroploca asiatica]|uniref:Uncharacterized protein n=1 Tax=Candidatus Chloroploca asiatica TaxID=1506545 RepID=A0A2H3KIS8_9CHLR|nr:tetratricopeptide repeat protein [Candidatus Chloroploca asiatica]PDV97762.1 hypothetical protein A9Q02_17615 [Candidatus Chloroploca asiatica]
MTPTPPADDPLTTQARAGLRRTRWPALLAGAGGAATLGLLGAAGLAPLLASLGVGTLATAPVVTWLTSMGMNALAGWVGTLATDGVQAALAEDEPDPAWVRDLGQRLDAAAAGDQGVAEELARLLQTVDALPLTLDALRAELSDQTEVLLAQHDLLQQLSADMQRLHVSGGALGPVVIAEADRVIAAITARSEARFDEVLAALTALRDTQRQALVDFGRDNQFRDVNIGDIAGRDIHKYTVVQQAFTPRPVAATADELAAAQATLAAMPTTSIPPPQDVLPPGSWLGGLRRNHQFVGRAADLQVLATLLKGGQSVAVNQGQAAVASGLGGIGKTQLAVEFAARYGQHFTGVFWLSFAQPDTIPTEFARLGGAAHLQLFTEAAGLKLDEQMNLVRSRLACGLPYLLIFDNCEDPQLVRAHHPGGATRVLITSRNPAWPGDLGVQRHALGVLSRAESCEMLRQHRPDLSDQEADDLAAELGDLPLALHLAGRFLAGPRKRLTVARYLEELRSPRLFDRLPLREQDGTLPTGHNRDVARSFALSYERLDPAACEDALALKLLARAAHLVPGEVVPTALLLATLEVPDDDLDAELAAEAALDRLVALGLIERESDDRLRMHRLVGAYVRQVSADRAAQADVEHVVIREAVNLVDAPTVAPLTAFLPVLRGVTDAALGREDERAEALCGWLAEHLRKLGNYTSAQAYAARAVAIRERVLGSDHLATVTSLNNLALLYKAQGQYDAARPLLARALAIHEHALGAAHPATATSLNNLAGLLHSQGDFAAARPLYARALAIHEHALGAAHPATATSLNNLAGLLHSQGDFAAARPLYARALAIHEHALGAAHPATATSLNNLAGLLHSQGDFAAARPLYERALAIHEHVLGSDHPDSAQTMGNLAALLDNQGDYASARPLLERALDIRERVLGSDHPDTAASLNSLALLLHNQGDFASAHPLYERALAIRERVLGPDHPDTAQTLGNLASLYQAQGDYDEALPLAERALAINEHVLGADHPNTATSLNNLAALLDNQGDFASAHPLYERALAIREHVLGPDHPDTAQTLGNLAIHHYDQNDYQTAERLMRRALAIREARLGPDHPDTQGSRQDLTAIQQRLRATAAPPPSDVTAFLAPLLTAIVAVANGNDAPRQLVTETLAQLEAQGWMLREPVERIWAGERDRAALLAGLDDQDAEVIAHVMSLIDRCEAPHPDTTNGREALLNSLPDAVRTAIIESDAVALQSALDALPEDERHVVIEHLQEARIIRRRPDMDMVLRDFEPLLCDMAAVANGDDGRLAEIVAVIAHLQAQGWQLMNAVQRIWVGERDEARLTEGIDANSAMLVRRILVLLSHPESTEPDVEQQDPLAQFAPLLGAIAAVANGDEGPREEVTAALAQLEQQGWRLREPVERLWAGERDREALVTGLDDQDAALIDRVLALIASP